MYTICIPSDSIHKMQKRALMKENIFFHWRGWVTIGKPWCRTWCHLESFGRWGGFRWSRMDWHLVLTTKAMNRNRSSRLSTCRGRIYMVAHGSGTSQTLTFMRSSRRWCCIIIRNLQLRVLNWRLMKYQIELKMINGLRGLNFCAAKDLWAARSPPLLQRIRCHQHSQRKTWSLGRARGM